MIRNFTHQIKYGIRLVKPTYRTSTSNRMSSTRIELTPPEKLFRECLLDCRAQMKDVPGMQDLEIRWTGGWVRDRLLNVTSHDIDVALSTMTGWQFGQALQKYMKENGAQYEERANKQNFKAEIKNLHKIEANPEKSKHLETITTKMFGIDIDFVNLRKEVYDEKSRNPQMEFGTPEEDALRRDACVNALFYNLDTQEVEDFTKRGLDDMKAGIIRTPLEPYQTFKDDPLRVLRLIRFAARLDYEIEPTALEKMEDPSIHEALRLKISRERVGVEIGKIMTGPNPYGGLTCIYDRHLYKTVFADPENNSYDPGELSDFPVALSVLQEVLGSQPSICLVLKPTADAALAWTLAAYVPYRDNEQAAVEAARSGIKATNLTVKVLGDAVKYYKRLIKLADSVKGDTATRAQVGVMLKTCGKSWRSHVLFALIGDVVDHNLKETYEKYDKFVRYVQEQKLEDAADLKPIINGNDIKKELGISKAGSWLKAALDMVVEWQFANPDGTAAEAAKMVAERRSELQID